jgi:hypothetical protein
LWATIAILSNFYLIFFFFFLLRETVCKLQRKGATLYSSWLELLNLWWKGTSKYMHICTWF